MGSASVILITTGVWKEICFGAIIYLAAIAGIDPNLYEAASMDGASRIKHIYYITIPGIAPVIIIFLILDISKILNAGFENILLLTNWGAKCDLAGGVGCHRYLRIPDRNSELAVFVCNRRRAVQSRSQCVAAVYRQ
jgi:ABC-type sugar transport system permease subunit